MRLLIIIPSIVLGCSGPVFEASPMPPPAVAGSPGGSAVLQLIDPVTGGANSTGGSLGRVPAGGSNGGMSSTSTVQLETGGQWQTGGSGTVMIQSSGGSSSVTLPTGGLASIFTGGDASTGGTGGTVPGSSTGGVSSVPCTGAPRSNGCFASPPSTDPGWSCSDAYPDICTPPLRFCILRTC